MWIVKYTGLHPETNKSTAFSVLLRPEKPYILGRSPTDIPLLGTKSVSRKACQITVHQNDYPNKVSKVNIKNLSKIPITVRNESLSPNDSTTLSSSFDVILGSSSLPFKFEVVRYNHLLKLPKDCDSRTLEELRLHDIYYKFTHASFTTEQIVKEVNSSCLYSLIKGISIVSMDYVKALLSIGDSWNIKFDEKIPKAGDYALDKNLLPNERRLSLFQGITFVVFDLKLFKIMQLTVETAKGSIELYDKELTQFQPWVEQFQTCILLCEDPSIELQSIISKLGIKIFTVRDILDAVCNVDISPLLERVSKRRRLTRIVKPLDSLAYFGGGVDLSPDKGQIKAEYPHPVDLEGIPKLDLTKKLETDGKYQIKVEPQLAGKSLLFDTSTKKPVRELHPNNITSKPLTKDEDVDKHIHPRKKARMLTKDDFLNAVAKVKENEVRKLTKELEVPTIDKRIENLRSLAIVETDSTLLRVSKPQSNLISNSDWLGRPNYKKFKKKNSNCMFREYVSMNDWNPNAIQSDSFVASSEDEPTPEVDQNVLFVVDSEEEESAFSKSSIKEKIIEKVTPALSMMDDDDDEPGFQFRRRG